MGVTTKRKENKGLQALVAILFGLAVAGVLFLGSIELTWGCLSGAALFGGTFFAILALRGQIK